MQAETVAMPLGNHLVVHHWGNLEGPPVVVAHGFMDSAVAFETAMSPLFERWHVIAPDQRGHGASDHIGVGGYYHFTDYVLDFHAVVAALDQPPVIIGHSMGASVGIYFAGAFPELVRALVLVDGIGPASGDPADGPSLMRRWIERVTAVAPTRGSATPQPRARALTRLKASAPGLSQAARDRVVDARTVPSGEGMVRYRFDRLHRTPGPWHVDGARFDAFCAAIAAPTLTLWGANSPFRHDDVEHREALIEHLETHTIQGAGHNIHLERPLPMGEAIVEFLDRHTS